MAERWVEDKEGRLVLIDDAGNILLVQKLAHPGQGRKTAERGTHHFVKAEDGRMIWVPRGTNPDSLPHKTWPLSQVTWDQVCTLIMEGKTLEAIGKMDGFPSSAILWNWKTKSPEFAAQFEAAKKARAEYRADKAMAIADDSDIAEADVPGRRLIKDILQWGAEMDDRQAFGKQTKVTGDSANPVVFHVTTGVPEPRPQPEDLGKGVLSAPPQDDGEEHA